MSLIVEVEHHGRATTSFHEYRAQLLREGGVFTEEHLSNMPYPHLALAAMANAGTAACSLDLVVAEKVRRRSRFLAMSPDVYRRVQRYVKSSGMYSDLYLAIEMQKAMKWTAIRKRVQLWMKLNCIHNHIDHPKRRLMEATRLLRRCVETGELSEAAGRAFKEHIDHILFFYPHSMNGDQLREKLGGMCDDLLDELDEIDACICAVGLVHDYSCTSDCYLPI